MRSHVEVRRITDAALIPGTLIQEIQSITEYIRERAFQRFESRGSEHGHDLEDWLSAERDIVGSLRDSEVTEDGAGYQVRIALQNFKPSDVQVISTPTELLVTAQSHHETTDADGGYGHSASDFVRTFKFPEPVDAGMATAHLDDGVLLIDVRKATQPKQIAKGA